MLEVLSPFLNMILGVIISGEDEGDPDGGQSAVRQTLVTTVAVKVVVESFGKVSLLGQTDEQGDFINPFMHHAGVCFHPVIMVKIAVLSAHHPENDGFFREKR